MTGKMLPSRLPNETQDEYTARTYALMFDVPMIVIRTDIARKETRENDDAYKRRLYTSLNEGECGNGYRRKGESLQYVGDSLEHLDQFGG